MATPAKVMEAVPLLPGDSLGVAARALRPLSHATPPERWGLRRFAPAEQQRDYAGALALLHELLAGPVDSNKYVAVVAAAIADIAAVAGHRHRRRPTLHSPFATCLRFEDEVRDRLGTEAFRLFTLDRLVAHLLKHMAAMATDENSLKLLVRNAPLRAARCACACARVPADPAATPRHPTP